jgi:hypothetical protein
VKQDANKIFLNPSGFIEQHFVGEQTPEAIIASLKKVEQYSKKLQASGKPILILEDISKIPKLEFLSPKMATVRVEAAKYIKSVPFERAAFYGPLPLQVIVNTLALVAGKRSKVQVFDSRANAIKWLLYKK